MRISDWSSDVCSSDLSSSILQVIGLYSPDGSQDTIFISNYGLLNVIDELKRIPGVGDASLFGVQDYSMRIWLRPDKLAQLGLTPDDVAQAIRAQNAQLERKSTRLNTSH